MENLIGEKLKELRRKKKLTLKELSEKSKLSIGFLSKLERGLCNISVESLGVIAQCLDTNVNYFFKEVKEPSNGNIVVRSYERQILYTENERRINFLLTNNINDIDFLPKLVELLPSFNEEEMLSSSHPGEEFLYVLEGILTVFINRDRYDLYPGDSTLFKSKENHIWVNFTNKIVKLIVVTSPNLFKDENLTEE
ncbi:MAG: cupin domain-containing protein [Eubacteriales bacterium]|nr:cupin domain-containing protein [Eubacteriales bacterium]